MARRLRKKRVAGAVIVLILIIAIPILIFRSCSADENTGNNGGNEQSTQTENSTPGTVTSTTAMPAIAWPNELSSYIKEYKGAGNMVGVNKGANDEGKTVYKVTYLGTSIDSCFDYSANTLEMGGDWTEAVTGELYTYSRETSTFILELSCEPKAANGYDLMIKVTVK